MRIALAAIIVSIAFLVLQAIPFLNSSYQTPPGRVYLGTIHHPQDYYYYLSQFTQGKDSWFLSYDLYTSEFREPVPIGWINVVLGRLFSLVSIEPIFAYQIATTLLTGILFIVSYLFIRHVMGISSRYAITFAFLFFILGNAYPAIVKGAQGASALWFYSYWFNLAEPFTRFSNVPHQIVGNIAIIAAFLAAMILTKTSSTRRNVLFMSFLLLCLGVILGSVQPVQWIIAGGVIAATNILFLCIRQRRIIPSFPKLILACYPSFLIFVGGFPLVIHLKELLTHLPYSQLTAWEASQQILAPPYYVFLAGGPVITAAFLGIVPLFRHPTRGRILTGLYFFSTSILFLSPLPKLVGIQNIRFLSPITFLTASILAADGIWFISSRLPKPNVTRIITIVVFICISLPIFWLQSIPRLGPPGIQNAFLFLDQSVIDGYAEARRRSTPSDTFIAYWPMDVTFPGLTGRRGFMGHPLLTISNEKKNELAYHFLIGKMTEAEAENLLREHNITYILAFNDTLATPYPFVQEVYRNNVVTLFKVITREE